MEIEGLLWLGKSSYIPSVLKWQVEEPTWEALPDLGLWDSVASYSTQPLPFPSSHTGSSGPLHILLPQDLCTFSA